MMFSFYIVTKEVSTALQAPFPALLRTDDTG